MYTLNCKGRLLEIDTPVIMGIINVTPDSFYDGSRKQNTEEIVVAAGNMLKEGAAILDIGGQSTRPGSVRVSAEEEAARVVPAIEAIKKNHPEAIISIDTYSSGVAMAALDAGASVINDVSGGDLDPEILTVAANASAPYICMHMQGTPDTMQKEPYYEDVTREVLDYLIKKIAACRAAGIKDIIADPGFGFGKTIQHNFILLRGLSVFKILDVPILAGISRKSTIYRTLGISAEHALNGTTVLNTIALMNGAHILRVHDVKAAAEAIQLVNACLQASTG
ncbi:MAG: dihydropteroate synthase [Chitinophagaceae bacterium]|nr:dihydropteroate synthase [Chitinophagaceae bacterium]MCW5927482.1 dihydropteroate synthase [Chitinophagaceae bacterium]